MTSEQAIEVAAAQRKLNPHLRCNVTLADSAGNYCVKVWDGCELISVIVKPLEQVSYNSIEQGPKLQAAELVRMADEDADYESAAKDVGFAWGWDLGAISTRELDRECNAVLDALHVLGSGREALGLRSTAIIANAILDGREARVIEAMMVDEARGQSFAD